MDNFKDTISGDSFIARKDNLIGTEFIYKPITESTNIDAKELGQTNGLSGTVIIASNQSKGRGRLGREWESACDRDIYMSFLLRLKDNSKYITLLPLLSALCVVDTISAVADINPLIKWPNDVVVNGKKLCGILCESNLKNGVFDFVVTGIGINVNRDTFSSDIEDKATSLLLETGRLLSRAEIINQLVIELNRRYGLLLEHGPDSFLCEYKNLCANLGRDVNIIEKGVSYTATAVDITDEGHLLIKDINGELRNILSGEVSVRGIYGYI
jgi:BirA family biotin operon repressor/biotin-[acetyl-CoA-carboxylase] ligase